jgi:predicted transcriptional regulator
MVKVTFTLDEETVRRLRKIADRTKKPQSLVVREAVADYAARDEKMSDEERERFLRVFDELVPKLPTRPVEEVERELRELRKARRRGWSRPSDR